MLSSISNGVPPQLTWSQIGWPVYIYINAWWDSVVQLWQGGGGGRSEKNTRAPGLNSSFAHTSFYVHDSTNVTADLLEWRTSSWTQPLSRSHTKSLCTTRRFMHLFFSSEWLFSNWGYVQGSCIIWHFGFEIHQSNSCPVIRGIDNRSDWLTLRFGNHAIH
jgi:hypothetical protein